MKKIALIHYAYPPNIGGVEILMREHAKILSEMGYEITIISGDGKEANSKIDFVKIPEIQSILKFSPPLYEKIVERGIIDDEFYSLAKIIENKLKSHLDQQDVIIVHNMLTLVHNLPFVYFLKNYLKKNPNKKLIVWTHDQTYIDGENILQEKSGVNLNQEEKELLLNPIDNAVYVIISETFKELLLKVMDLSNNQTVVIPDGIDIKKFLEIEDSIWEIVEKKNLLKCFPVILSPVNILARKNLDYTIDIISLLKKTYPDIKYVISGGVSNHRKNLAYFEIISKKIEQLDLKNNVIFLKDFFGRSLENREIHDLYDIADLVFFLSKAENFGLPVLEAILSKTPIFVSNLKVFREIGENKLIFVEMDKPKKTAEEVLKYLENNNLIKLNRKVKQNYDLKSIIKDKLVPLL